MPVVRLEVGPLETNTFLVWREGEKEALVVDAGGEAERIAAEIESRGLAPRVLFLTHAHVDHIAAAAELARRYPDMETLMPAAERETLERPTHNLSYFLAGEMEPPSPSRWVEPGEEVTVGSMAFEVIAVPGHTPGGAALHGGVDGEGYLLSGDAVFSGSIGRSDFPGGDGEVLVAAIKERLLSLPEGTRICPGHGPETTVGAERRTNPFLR